MKGNVNLLRGYDNSHSEARSIAKAGAPSVVADRAKKRHKNRKSYFSNPSLYTLPSVYTSKKR